MYVDVLTWTPRFIYGNGLTLSDRLASQVTVSFFVLFGMLSILDHYVGKPDLIQCKCPAAIRDCDKDFINSACWVQNEFYLPRDPDAKPEVMNSTGNGNEEKLEMDTAYFQWIGLLLIAQGVLGFIPRAVWLWLSAKAGFSEQTYLAEARSLQSGRDPEYYERSLRILVRNIERLIVSRRHRSLSRVLRFQRFFSGLTFKFFFCKVFYILISACQIVLVVVFGGVRPGLLRSVTRSDKLNPAKKLPSMLICKLKQDTDPDASYLCALPGNLLHQTLFAFLFCRLIFIIACNVLSLFSWLIKFSTRLRRHRLIRKILTKMDDLQNFDMHEKGVLISFVDKYLQTDGILMVRLIEYCTDHFTMCAVVHQLWQRFRETRVSRSELRPIDDDDL